MRFKISFFLYLFFPHLLYPYTKRPETRRTSSPSAPRKGSGEAPPKSPRVALRGSEQDKIALYRILYSLFNTQLLSGRTHSFLAECNMEGQLSGGKKEIYIPHLQIFAFHTRSRSRKSQKKRRIYGVKIW